jgi:HSP20 family protein
MASLLRWQPVRDLDGFVDDVERWLGLAERSTGGAVRFVPACEVAERDGETVLRLDVPGVDPERDLEVRVDGEVLTISGERRRGAERTSETTRYREGSYGRFERCLNLPEGTDPASIRAHYEQGVLEVVVPTAAAPAPVRVPVTHSAAPIDAAADAA